MKGTSKGYSLHSSFYYFVALLFVITAAIVVSAQHSPLPSVTVDEGLLFEELLLDKIKSKKDPRITFVGDLVMVYNPELPEPYTEITMLSTPENVAKLLHLNKDLRFIDTVVRGVIYNVDAEKAKEALKQKILQKRDQNDNVPKFGPKPTATPF